MAPTKYIVQRGGTNSAKTVGSLGSVFAWLDANPGLTATVTAKDFPMLKRGALRDFKRYILTWEGWKGYLTENKSDHTFIWPNGSMLEFATYGDEDDAKSGKRDILLVDEANRFDPKIFDALAIRTTHKVVVCFNPAAHFWVDDVLQSPERIYNQKTNPTGDVTVYYSNYRHNPECPPEIIADIERKRLIDPEWYRVYGLGKKGRVQGLVFKWDEVAEVPAHAKLLATGMDYGYGHAPTAALRLYEADGKFFLDEMAYNFNVESYDDIERMLVACGIGKREHLRPDNSDKLANEELKKRGWNIHPAVKGPDSIDAGVAALKQRPLCITTRSKNLLREMNAYRQENGKYIGVDHLIDCARYAAEVIIKTPARIVARA